MRNRRIGITLIALSIAMVCGLAIGCAVPPSTSTPNSAPAPEFEEGPASAETTIVGKWRHDLPKLPENETYYLEFFKSGEVVWSGEEKIFAGTYRFIGDNYIEMTWDFMAGTLGEALVGKVYEIRISGDKMTLMPKGQWLNGTFRRVH